MRAAGTVTNLSRTPNPEERSSIILVADDDLGIGGALQVLFEINSLFAEVVQTPIDAMGRVRRGGVQLVIHDMNFSRGETSVAEGLGLFRDLRREVPHMPVILMTSWPAPGTRALVLHEGANAYLTKPWDDRDLVLLVQGLVGVEH